jgi:hypothetical protein
MFDFPANPPVGTNTTLPDGAGRTWDGQKWRAGQGTIGAVTVSDTPPTGPKPGQLWFDSANPQLYLWYSDPNSSQWVIATANAGGLSADAPVDGNTYGRLNGAWATVSGGGGTARNSAKLQAQWVTGAIVANDTVYLAYDAPYAGTINALTYFTGNGSFSVAIQINGTNVTGLSAVSVSSATPATATATAANTFTAGQRITAVITSATGSPTDALLSLAVTWS